jgi:general secretion pathway protein L
MRTLFLDEVQPEAEGPVLVAAPADAVALHLVSLPALAPAQALAAARVLAGELSATPVECLHVALGPVRADGRRWLALAEAEMVADWVARLAGVDVVALVPAPLLLPEGSRMARDGLVLVHEGETAFAAEPALAEMLCPALGILAEVTALGGQEEVLDLRQGRFSAVQAWRPEAGRLRRLGWLGVAAGIAWLGAELAGLWQAGRAADAMEARVRAAAVAVLPPGTLVDDPVAQVQARLAALGGRGVTGEMAALMTALEGRPGVAIAGLERGPQGLSVLLEGGAPGDIAAIAAALGEAGMVTETGLPRAMAGQSVTELRVRMP